jgi:hypothetical protein
MMMMGEEVTKDSRRLPCYGSPISFNPKPLRETATNELGHVCHVLDEFSLLAL